MPIEKTKESQWWKNEDGDFETKQDKPWKTSLAIDLNDLMEHAKNNPKIKGAILRVVRRVAEFEGIRRAK